MTGQDVINYIGLDKAVSTDTDKTPFSVNSAIDLDQIAKFGVDYVYFNTDDNNNSFPSVFLKKVENFEDKILQQIAETQRNIWNFKKVMFLYVYSETQIRIYSCSEQPVIKTKGKFNYESELQKIEIGSYEVSNEEQIRELNHLFSTIALDTGIIWTIEEAEFVRKKLNLQKRVDKYLVESLVNTARQLENQGLEIDFIHKIILRSLFLLYLEDRGATDFNFYSKIKEGAKSYFDLLDDVNSTYELYSKLEKHFNGNVFSLSQDEKISVEQLQLVKNCFISGNDNTPQVKIYNNWRLFNFSIIQIELLSEIYEKFLTETDPQLKKRTGTYYTPPSLVEFILNEKLPVNNGESNYNVKILDPTCGSGIFLVESFKRLVKRYENFHGHKLTDFNRLKMLLTDNIYGIEVHPQAIKVASFSLYLALVDNLNPKTIWQTEEHLLPSLINNPEDLTLKTQGENLYCTDTIKTNSKIENIKFDLVVGNPPFGKSNLSESIKNYCDEFGFAKEMVLPFLHKATKFAPKGEIALIFNTKVLTNTGGTYQNFRKWLFQTCYVEKIYNFSILRKAPKNFGGQLFGDATGPISIVYYKSKPPNNPTANIAYYAPKTFIKSSVIEGLSIDFTDLKFLPREECEKSDTKIWKITMWGGINDWKLIDKISKSFNISISDFLNMNSEAFEFGSGLHSPSKKQIEEGKVFIPDYVINLRKVKRYYTPKSALVKSNKVFRNVNRKIFTPPYLLLKEGQKDKDFCSTIIDYNSFNTGYNISTINNDFIPKLKLWCSLINSSFAKYFLSLTSASWGIERERVQANETLTLPSFSNLGPSSINKLNYKFDSLIAHLKDDFNSSNTLLIEESINNFILNDVLNLSEKEIWLIEDLINFSVDLFNKKEKSIALYTTTKIQISIYSKIISDEINEFLQGQNLYANITFFKIERFSPLLMIKILFQDTIMKPCEANESMSYELKELDKYLWKQESTNIYFRKKLNYKKGNDIYIIRPNQRRFWSKSMALDDASELILEILNEI